MKLNPSCIRKILIYIEKYSIYEVEPNFNEKRLHLIGLYELYNCKELSKYQKEDIYYNVQKMFEGNLLTGTHRFNNDPNNYAQCEITGITFYGHEILDNVKEEPIWAETKKHISKVGSLSINIVSQIAGATAAEYTKRMCGFDNPIV